MSARQFDPGPPSTFETLFAACPPPVAFREHFWFDWGPIFYRGRLDGSARVLAIASDPGATERVVGRTLVGDAGQRVQGLLAKIGLDRLVRRGQRLPLQLHPEPRVVGQEGPPRPGADGLAQPAVRRARRPEPPGDHRLRRVRPVRRRPLADRPGRPDPPPPPPVEPLGAEAPRCLARGGHRVAWPGDARPGRADEPPELRRHLRRIRLRADPVPRPPVRRAGLHRERRLGPRDRRPQAASTGPTTTPSSGWPPGPPAAGTRHPDAYPLRPHRPDRHRRPRLDGPRLGRPVHRRRPDRPRSRTTPRPRRPTSMARRASPPRARSTPG